MGFFDAELAKPYSSLYYSYPSEDARLDQDAANRGRQFAAQGAAARGGGANPRGAATNTYNRIMSDYTLGKAQTDRQNRLNYTNTMGNLMSRPGSVSPSTASTLGTVGGVVGASILNQAAPDIWKKMRGGLGWDSTPDAEIAKYNSILAGGAPAQSFNVNATSPDWSGGSYMDQSPAYASVMDYSAIPDYSYGGALAGMNEGFGGFNYGDVPYGDIISSAPSFVDTLPAEEISNLFNSGFIGW